MIKISDLDKIVDNLEILGYTCEKTNSIYIFKKEHNRFDIDIDVHEVRLYTQTKSWSLQKTFTLHGFIDASTEWIKKHKLKIG